MLLITDYIVFAINDFGKFSSITPAVIMNRRKSSNNGQLHLLVIPVAGPRFHDTDVR